MAHFTLAVAEAGRFIGGNLFDVAEETIPANSSESPRSFGMEGEETMEGDWFYETPDDERSIPLTETPVSGSRGGYPDYDEFESDSDVSGELEGMGGGVPANGVPANVSSNDVPANDVPSNSSFINGIPANLSSNDVPSNSPSNDVPSNSPSNPSTTPPSNSLSQLKANLASRLSYDMTAYSCQIWRVFSQLVLALQTALSPACSLLLRHNATHLRRRFGALLRCEDLSLAEVDAHVGIPRECHPGTGCREATSCTLHRHSGGSQVLVGVEG